MATDPNAPEQAAQQASDAVGQSFANSREGLAMNQARLGLSLTPEEKQVQDRRLGLAEAATRVGAANEAKAGAQDRQQRILAGSGGLQNVPTDQLMQQGM